MHDNRNNNMETFYEENGQYVTATQTQTTDSLKRPLTLDLNAVRQPEKKKRLNQSVITPVVLNTPDTKAFVLPTPEIESIILDVGANLQTPTPSQLFAPNTPKVTSEQEDYARPFVDLLKNMHQTKNGQQQQQSQITPKISTTEYYTTGSGAIVANPVITTSAPAMSAPHASTIFCTVGMSGGSVTYTDIGDSYPVTIKDEPPTIPNSPPMSPIDMDNQEKIKLERKRQRNRLAASKCRRRKLERISKLEDKVKILKGENAELGGVIKSLREHVFQLKQQVIDHVHKGCSIPAYDVSYFARSNISDIK